MDVMCGRCGAEKDPQRLFCQCGKLLDREGLKSVRLPGEIGVQKLEAFWATGDPALAVNHP